MPIYEYTCRSCEHEFEELAKSMASPDRVKCPSCGAARVERKLSVFAARLGAETKPAMPRGAGCGHCGDPHGPCGM